MNTVAYTSDDIMTVVAARTLEPGAVTFVGIGLPSTAANLARITTNPDCVLIYESGCIGSKPVRLPSSIGDGVLAENADAVIAVPEIFAYWLQAGRIDIGFLGAAQIDRYANLNTTVIGAYDDPLVRLPGAGGAPEIAANCRRVIITLRHSTRALVEKVDFITSFGYGNGGDEREKLGLRGGPTDVITDLGVLRPDPITKELMLTAVHPGVTVEQVRAATGWDLKVAPGLVETEAPTAAEMDALTELRNA
jgi:glutaconate CoA-transferase, subunit B